MCLINVVTVSRFLFLLDVRFVFPRVNSRMDRPTVAEKLAYERAMGYNN